MILIHNHLDYFNLKILFFNYFKIKDKGFKLKIFTDGKIMKKVYFEL